MRRLTLVSGAKAIPVTVDADRRRLLIHVSEPPVSVDMPNRNGAEGVSFLVAGRSYEPLVTFDDGEILVEVDGERYVFRAQEGTKPGPGSPGSSAQQVAEVRAPMPGKVVKLLAASGETVEAGQGVLLFEAMKMQNEIRSPLSGRLDELEVVEGQAVESRERLFVVRAK